MTQTAPLDSLPSQPDAMDRRPTRSAPPLSLRCLPWAVALLVAACSGDSGPDGATGQAGSVTLLSTSVEPASAQCAVGGVRVLSGLDINADGVLQPSEVTQSQVICNGANGTDGAAIHSLVATSPEPAGSHCAVGGTRVSAGMDTNNNGVLDAAEISTISHVCNGNNGATGPSGPTGADATNSLIRMVPQALGSTQCPTGGHQVMHGLDTNRNGTLDDSEVTATSYVCAGASGATGPTGPAGPQGPGVTWSVVNSHTQAQPNQGFVVDGNSEVRVTLPASPSIGDLIQVSGAGTGGWRLATQNNQVILSKGLVADYFNPGQFLTAQGPTANWHAVALSRDGSKAVAAVNGGTLYYSHDAGATWTASNAASTSWFHVAASADGTRMVAGARPFSNVSVSADAGVTWTVVSNSIDAATVAMSTDGLTIVAADHDAGKVYRSTNFGAAWTQIHALHQAWGLGVSGDGNTIIVGGSGAPIQLSLDGGATWQSRGPTTNWSSAHVSVDGTRMAAAGDQGVWVSTDSGVTWTQKSSVVAFENFGMSGDGMTMLLARQMGQPLTSSDGGDNWAPNTAQANQYWQGVAVSGDGKQAIVGVSGGQLWTSVNERSSPQGGGLGGGQFDAVTLQFLGSDVFVPLSQTNYTGRFRVY
jgi:hypothetical protein